MRTPCPKCGDMLVLPAGPTNSKILLVGEYPGNAEVMAGVPFCGESGKILRTELIRVGMQLEQCRVTNLWQHYKDEAGCDIDWHKTQMAKEFKGKKLVLLMGSDLSKLLFGKGIMDITGLEFKHAMFPGVRLFMSPNPAQLMHGPVGEFRLALSRFKEAIDEI